MTDPTRFRDADSGAPPELQRLFARAAEDVPSSEQLASLAAKLGPVLGPAAGAPAGGGATPSSTSAAGSPTLVKLGLAAAVAVGAAALVWRSSRVETPAPAASATVAAPTTAVAPAAPGSPATPAPVAPESSRPADAPAAGDAAAPSAPALSSEVKKSGGSARPVESEADLLERARSALASDPARALTLTQQHRARFPGGVLAQEREVIAIEALKQLHRTDEAAARAADFARRYPGSAYRKKLDAGAP